MSMNLDKSPKCDNPASCGCGPVSRREALQWLGLGAAATMTTSLGVMAGPFSREDFEKLIPADKKLDPQWVKSLYERGIPTVYRGEELRWIGMPVGGLCAGQVYLGGDGRLWHWDIFNHPFGTNQDHYARPMQPGSPVQQGFAVRIGKGDAAEVRPLDHTGFADVRFRGEYPIGRVEYRDPKSPVEVAMEAFSPFVPLATDDSSLPATLFEITVKNTSQAAQEVELGGWLDNAVCLHSLKSGPSLRVNKSMRVEGSCLMMRYSVASPKADEASDRPDIMFEQWTKPTYEGWTTTGTAFGAGPIPKNKIPAYQGDVGGPTASVVNSHNTRQGEDTGAGDAHVGTLTSRPFTIERRYIRFWIGGGNHAGKTCMNLEIDGKVVASVAGPANNRMREDQIDARAWAGKQARLVIVDNERGPWGNIGVGQIVFTDKPVGPQKMTEQPDHGTMALSLLKGQADDRAVAALPEPFKPADVFAVQAAEVAKQTADHRPVGALVRRMNLAPGQSATATFAITWHFPNLRLKEGGRYYATRFQAADCVASHLATNLDRLTAQTRLWRDTWYDSTLPYWFLDRTMLNTSILATSTAHRFRSGRFWGWEGVGCCDGTCTHVWHYAHAVGRLFPELERNLRQRTDFGLGIDPKTGVINHRGDHSGMAVDGQAGCILRAYREHQMSKDAAFLKALWPKVKLAMDCLVRMDKGEGILEGPQHNTLDQAWFGRVAWLTSLYLAAAKACEAMATELGEEAYAKQMREIAERGRKAIDRELFNGEYYYHIPDKDHAKTVGSHNGCEIDQVFGQSWAFQVGLGRVLDEKNVKTALASLWRYNFTPDVGPFRAKNKPGRWYAMAGEAGLIMCTWPKGDAARVQTGFDFYFNECMNGFEYQVAGHMIWEGMVQQGLAITRAVHDRYHASRRNPWNEVECGDHYARSMASYGVYLAACGFEYHGPKGHLGFAPRLTPENFRAAFTAAEGWGTYAQKAEGDRLTASVALKHGSLRLKTLALVPPSGKAGAVKLTLGGREIAAGHELKDGRLTITLAQDAVIDAGQTLEVVVG